ncbi:sterol desaturase family protein [Shinella sp.]|uniref:sterol desaturase family protein n=1 Tax=Shinella sp. TaxID=1870904 RepID=UPI00258F39C7|nr:sterol desaturase family protein [Shinella sp.]MCW5706873.1 sterol desaturase family protein [Shinella sp.]
MDDLKYGTRNKRGDWKPNEPIAYPPLFTLPPKPWAFLKWFFGFGGYILPWNLAYAGVAAILWFYFTPSMETIRADSYWWVAYLFARNAAITLGVYGVWHFGLYVKQVQEKQFKYNIQWPSNDNQAFLFKRQNVDNVIWTFASGVPIWTAYEAGMLWLFAKGYIPFVEIRENPVYFVVLMLLIPLIHDLHFYLVHRVLHWGPLYKAVHSLHHNNVNPGPWSGLAMHPIEHLMYFSGVLLHAIIPSHPIHALFHIYQSALGPAQSHAGFDKIVVGEEGVVDTHGFQHYLHHKYFECNYADGAIPLDKWFGTFHDGSPESQAAMDKRFMERTQKQAAKAAGRS